MENEDSLFTNGVNRSVVYEVENPEDAIRLSLFGRALSAPVRLQMLRLINKKNMLASELAEKLSMPLSSALFHLRVLEEAELIKKEYTTKGKGSMHWYTYGCPKKSIVLLRNLDGEASNHTPSSYVYNICIGDYIDAEFSPNCGIATEREHIMENKPNLAFNSERHNAQIIWSHEYGSLTYALPNDFALNGRLAEIRFSLEICSEALGYNNDYPSDITFSVNGKEVCTFTSPGDFGDRYGKFTPPWWFPESTKYGLLTTVSIRDNGVFLNEKPVNKQSTLSDLHLSEGNKMTFKLEVKKDAKHAGGFNVFGDKFGDYNQNILFTAIYTSQR